MVIDKSRLAFELKVTDAKYDGKVNAAGTEATGTWTQRGASLPLAFVKKDKVTPEPMVVGKEQIWEGKLGLGAGLAIRIVVRVQKTEDGHLIGRFESPDQTAQRFKLDSVTLEKTKLAFVLKAVGASYEGKLSAAEDEAVGTFTQGGVKIPLTLKKTDKVSVVRRPQTPRPPFPYKIESLEYRNEPAGITLAGTLTIPEGRGPFPAVISDQRLRRSGPRRDDLSAQAFPAAGRYLDPPWSSCASRRRPRRGRLVGKHRHGDQPGLCRRRRSGNRPAQGATATLTATRSA